MLDNLAAVPDQQTEHVPIADDVGAVQVEEKAAVAIQARMRRKGAQKEAKKRRGKKRRDQDLQEEAMIRDKGKIMKVVSSLQTFLVARWALVLVAICVVLIFFNWESQHGGEQVASWVVNGALAGASGALLGVLAALLLSSGEVGVVSRVTCSAQCDMTKCGTWCTDVWKGLLAFLLSLAFACAGGGFLIGLLAVVLSAFPGEIEPGSLYMVELQGGLALLFAYQVVRHYFKTRRGWWRRGEWLTDDDDTNDFTSLL